MPQPTQPTPGDTPRAKTLKKQIDIEKMNEAARMLEEIKEDFKNQLCELISNHPYFKYRNKYDGEIFWIWRDGKIIDISLSDGAKWRVEPKQ